MKKSLHFFLVLVAAFICQNSAFAQANTYLNLGLNIPNGKYGSNANNCILFNNGDYGGANLGFNVGFKFVNHTKAEGLGFMFTVDGMFNMLKNNIKAEDFVPYYVPEIEGIAINVKNPKYLNLPIMAGLNYSFRFNRNFGAFVEAGAGVNARFITPCKITAYDYTLELKPDYTFKSSYTAKFCFTYQVGLGFTIKDAIYLGINYFNLGSATVEGSTEKLLKTTASAPVVGETETFKYGQLATRMFVIRLGIHLQ